MVNRNPRVAILAAVALGVVVAPASPASATGFTKSEYQVGESDGYVDLTLHDTFCCPTESGQFDYYTANLSALAGADYEQTSGTMTVATCGPCTIRVPIIGDKLFEGEEQFEVKLTNFRGTFMNRGDTTAVVRILDDDAKPTKISASGLPSQQISATPSGRPLRSQSPDPAAAGWQPDEASAELAEGSATENRTREEGDRLAARGHREAGRSAPPFVALVILLVIGLSVLRWIMIRTPASS